MTEQIERGKKIIVELFLKISSAYNLKIDNMQWGLGEKDFDRGNFTLVYFIGDKRYSENFTEEELEDLLGTPGAPKEMAIRIEKIIKDKTSKPQSTRKIGF